MKSKNTSSNETPLIGVLINQIDGRYQSILYKGMSDYVSKNSIELIFFVGRAFNSPYPGEEQYNSIYELAKSNKIDGLIVVSGSIGNYIGNQQLSKYLEEFADIPKISLSFKLDGIPSIMIDNYTGMKEILEHLITKHGYRKIAYIGGPEGNFESLERFKAYKETIQNFGLSFRKELVFQGDFSYRSGHNYSQEILKGNLKDFDVIVCANDEMAIGLLSGLQGKQEILKNLHITGFDDLMEAKSVVPSLTTIRSPIYEQGYLACKFIKELIDGNPIESELYLKTRLIIRESCGCFESTYHKYFQGSEIEENKNDKKITIEHSNLIKIIHKFVDVKENEVNKFDYLLENILDALSFDLTNKPKKDCFTKELNFAFQFSLDFLYFEDTWQTVLIILRDYLQQILESDKILLTYSNDLIQRGEIILAKWIEKKGYQYSYELYGLLYNLRHTVRKVNTVFSMKALMDILVEEIMIFNLKKFYFCLFDEVRKNIDLSTKTRILLRCDDGNIKEESQLFDVSEILPGKILDDRKTNIFVAMSICNRDMQYGYIIFGNPEVKPVVYEFFREQIGGAISSVKLYEEKERETNELKKMFTEIKENESKFKEMVLMLPTALIDIGLDGRISFINQVGMELLEIKEKGLNILQYIHPDDRERFQKDFSNTLYHKENSFNEYSFVSEKGKKNILLARMIPIEKKKEKIGVRINAFNLELLRSSFIMPEADFFEKYKITEREKEIILLLLQSYRIKDISSRLFIAESTVKGHIIQIYSKLGVNNKSEMLKLLEKYKVSYSGYYSYLLSSIKSD